MTDPDIFQQSKHTDHETNKIKNLAVQDLNKQGTLKEHTALHLLEKLHSV